MKVYAPEFAYRGRRDYIHTVDMYDYIIEGATRLGQGEPGGPFRLNIRRMTHHHLDICYAETGDDSLEDDGISGDFTLVANGEPVHGWLLESDRPVEMRRAYEEGGVEKSAQITDNGIAFSGRSGMSAIELATCLTRILHETLIPEASNEKWVDVRVDLDRLLRPEDTSAMEVCLVKNLDNKWTKSVICVSDSVIGALHFSLIQR